MIMGGTAPTTIAGGPFHRLADSPHRPCHQPVGGSRSAHDLWCCRRHMDMKTMQHCYGAPEWMLLHGASAQIFHYMGLPVFHAAGVSDPKVVDAQSATESTMQIVNALGTGNF